jgi:hypothetical protein
LAIPLLATAGGFLKEVDTVEPQRLSRYFPRRGEFTHRRTIYAAGRDSVAERRYPAEILPDALNGPLYPVFRTEQHRQPIGPFAHQVVIRGRGWKYVGSNRFVPPDADETSVVYMIWRLEDERWVIAEIADELYLSGRLPQWCCWACSATLFDCSPMSFVDGPDSIRACTACLSIIRIILPRLPSVASSPARNGDKMGSVILAGDRV